MSKFDVYICGEGCEHKPGETELEAAITDALGGAIWDEIWRIEANNYEEAEAIAQRQLNDAERFKAQIAFSEPVCSEEE